MRTESGVDATYGGLSYATQLAILEAASEQADCESDRVIRDAERAERREHLEQQVQALRDKAGHLALEAVVVGGLQIGSGVVQLVGAEASYDHDVAKAEKRELDAASSSLHANRYAATSTFLTAGARSSELVFTSMTNSDDAHAVAQAAQSEDARARAEDAEAARQRARSQLDQKLEIVEQLIESEAETAHTLIRPA